MRTYTIRIQAEPMTFARVLTLLYQLWEDDEHPVVTEDFREVRARRREGEGE